MEEHDISYLEANASKYIVRYDMKGTPAQDLRKASSYLLRLLQDRRGVRRRLDAAVLEPWLLKNGTSGFKDDLLRLILQVGTRPALEVALSRIEAQIKELEPTRRVISTPGQKVKV
jgi:hypothetical protein